MHRVCKIHWVMAVFVLICWLGPNIRFKRASSDSFLKAPLRLIQQLVRYFADRQGRRTSVQISSEPPVVTRFASLSPETRQARSTFCFLSSLKGRQAGFSEPNPPNTEVKPNPSGRSGLLCGAVGRMKALGDRRVQVSGSLRELLQTKRRPRCGGEMFVGVSWGRSSWWMSFLFCSFGEVQPADVRKRLKVQISWKECVLRLLLSVNSPCFSIFSLGVHEGSSRFELKRHFIVIQLNFIECYTKNLLSNLQQLVSWSVRCWTLFTSDVD